MSREPSARLGGFHRMKEHEINDRRLRPGDEALPGKPGLKDAPCPECRGEGALADGGVCPSCAGKGRAAEGVAGA